MLSEEDLHKVMLESIGSDDLDKFIRIVDLGFDLGKKNTYTIMDVGTVGDSILGITSKIGSFKIANYLVSKGYTI